MYRRGMEACGPDSRERLGCFLEEIRAGWAPGLSRQRDFLFPDPRKGSACKRHNLFLRWMVRKEDGVDLGIWTALSPGDLIVPVDTHMARMGCRMGWTRRRAPDWLMAEEITAAFRAVCPDDPVKFDFALTRIGILGECAPRRPGACDVCAVAKGCAERRIHPGN